MLIGPSQQKIVTILSDGNPYSQRDLAKNTGLGSRAVECALKRLWNRGIILRTEKPIRKHQEVFRGRAGYGRNLRSYHLYILAPNDTDSLVLTGTRFLRCEDKLTKNTQTPSFSTDGILAGWRPQTDGWRNQFLQI
jgi:DNA-binding Lrp family transcriptional regulator